MVASQGFNFYGNTSSAFINELKFAAAKSIRTSFIVLATFNILAAVGVICGVLYDSVVAARKDDPRFKFRFVRDSYFATCGHVLIEHTQALEPLDHRPRRGLSLRCLFGYLRARYHLCRGPVERHGVADDLGL